MKTIKEIEVIKIGHYDCVVSNCYATLIRNDHISKVLYGLGLSSSDVGLNDIMVNDYNIKAYEYVDEISAALIIKYPNYGFNLMEIDSNYAPLSYFALYVENKKK